MATLPNLTNNLPTTFKSPLSAPSEEVQAIRAIVLIAASLVLALSPGAMAALPTAPPSHVALLLDPAAHVLHSALSTQPIARVDAARNEQYKIAAVTISKTLVPVVDAKNEASKEPALLRDLLSPAATGSAATPPATMPSEQFAGEGLTAEAWSFLPQPSSAAAIPEWKFSTTGTPVPEQQGAASSTEASQIALEPPSPAPVWLVVAAALPLGIGLALYHRISRAEVLESDQRRAALEFVGAHPGVTAARLAEARGNAYGTARHHLAHLTRQGLVLRHRVGGHWCYFPVSAAAPHERTALGVAARPTSSRVLSLIGARPGILQSHIARELGLAKSSVSAHIKRLSAHGLLERGPDGGLVRAPTRRSLER